jgi:hypothetical protein
MQLQRLCSVECDGKVIMNGEEESSDCGLFEGTVLEFTWKN